MSKPQATRVATKATQDGSANAANSLYWLANASFKHNTNLSATGSMVKDEAACYRALD
jgi:hypothetical protein